MKKFDMASIKLKAPESLSPAAQKEWKRVLKAYGTLKKCEVKEIDVAILAVYCESVAIYNEAQSEYQKGKMLMQRKDGKIVENPYIKIMQKEGQNISRYAEQLCFTPSSRAKRKIEDKKVSKLERVFEEIEKF